MKKVIIIGGGKGCMALLPIMPELGLKVVGVADINSKAPGIAAARKLGIKTTKDFHKLLTKKADFVIDVTGMKDFIKEIRKAKAEKTDIIIGLTAKLLWDIVKEKKKREEQAKMLAIDRRVLHDISLLLSSKRTLKETLSAVLKSAMHLTKMPAGSLVLYDDKNETFNLVSSFGFSKNFSSVSSWKLRAKGLTARILLSKKPIVIEDTKKEKEFNNPVMLKEEIMSLIAIPLFLNEKIIGIIYIDDFKKRKFEKKDIEILNLYAEKASIAIVKAKFLEKQKQLAITDELTGIFNYRHAKQMMDKELERAERYEHALSVCMVDIDYFKKYNDNYGHQKGDRVLKNVAVILSMSIRNTDILARYGGEEFIVIMPETNTYEAEKVAERIRESIEKSKIGETKITVSAGISSCPYDGKNREELVEIADKALYLAKSLGRNRVCNKNGEIEKIEKTTMRVLKAHS